MSSTAVNLRHDDVDASAASSRATGRCDRRNETAAVSTRLLEYWRVTLPLPIAARRRALDAACAAARREVTTDLLAFALGDTDDEIVYRATIEHVSQQAPINGDPLHDVIEWIRRRLALNCAAVFAALLSLGDEAVLERLRPIRVALDDRECERVLRQLASQPPGPLDEFLRTWSELHGQTAALPARGADSTSAALQGAVGAR